MILSVKLFDQETCTALRDRIGGLTWRDGAKTAGARAKTVKRNYQADLSTQQGQSLSQDVLKAVSTHPVMRAAAQPKRFSKLIVSRSQNGGGYGPHIDNAIMGSGETALRSDLSFTVFLSDPDEYDGGSLDIDENGTVRSFKPEAGTLVLYPSTTIHQVAPVTRGQRIVCVGWIESRVRSAEQRNILFDLSNVRAELARTRADSAEGLVLDKIQANLLRLWAET